MKDKPKYLIFVGLASEIVVLEFVLIYAGRWFDEKTGLSPLGVLLGSMGALVIWMFHLISALKGLEKNTGEPE